MIKSIAKARQDPKYINKNEYQQALDVGSMVLLRNSQRDGRKGGKLQQHWLGLYKVQESVGKGVYKLLNPSTGKALKKVVNVC